MLDIMFRTSDRYLAASKNCQLKSFSYIYCFYIPVVSVKWLSMLKGWRPLLYCIKVALELFVPYVKHSYSIKLKLNSESLETLPKMMKDLSHYNR